MPDQIQQLEERIAQSLLRDRAQLSRLLSRVRQRHKEGKPCARELDEINSRLSVSESTRDKRAANLPEIVNRAPASKQDKAQPRSKKTLKSSENDEKESETSKASSDRRRNNELEN